MKQLLFIWFLFLVAHKLCAQDDGYVLKYAKTGQTNEVQYTKYDIVSDYGARAEGSYWHRGIDFRRVGQPVGDRIKSPCPGTVKKIQGSNGYKYIIVEGEDDHANLGYGHIFETFGPTIDIPLLIENMVLILTQEQPPIYVILNIDEAQAYGIEEGFVTYNEQEYPVTNTVSADQELAIIGNSMNIGYTVEPHLHLYAFRDIEAAIDDHNDIYNNYDPLSVLDYGTHTQYSCDILEHVIKYGTSGNSYFKLRATMDNAVMGSRYANAVMDVDLVELFIKPGYALVEDHSNWGTTNSSYQYYKGQYYTSKIDHGGRFTFNPSRLFPVGITTGQGSSTKTGIEPIAYRTNNGHPWDNFYFSDFYPLIHKEHTMGSAMEYARNIFEARYSDGNYAAFLKVSTVKDHVFTTNDPYDFSIDNFVPFVQRVEIQQEGSEESYIRQWNPTPAGNFVFSPAPDIVLELEDLQITITTSEAMTEVELVINDFAQTKVTALNDERTQWQFNVPGGELHNHAFNELFIGGEDIHGNAMQKDAEQIPIRQSANPDVFSPALRNGYDENHEVFIGHPDVDFTAEQSGLDDLTFRFFPESPHTVFAYSWDFGDGHTCNQPPNAQCESPAHTYTTEGVFYVTLTINGIYEITKSLVVEHLTAPTAGFLYVPRVIQNRDEEPVIEVDFFNTSEGIVNNFNWNFGNGTTSQDENPVNIQFDPNTNYEVTLTVSNVAGTDFKENDLYFDPSTMPWAGIVAWRITDYLWDFDISAENMDPPYSYTIEYGDGLSQTLNDDYHVVTFNHFYSQYGVFQVRAFITGIDPQTGIERTVFDVKEISVKPDDILISLVNETSNDMIYPYTDVILRPVLYDPGSFNEWTLFSETYTITKVGEPSYYEVVFYNNYGPSFDERHFQFESEGEYQIQLYITASGYLWGGNAESRIIVENAPKFLQASVCCNPFTICQGAQNTYYAQIEPISNPGWPEENWYPTNVRWTLFDSQDNIIDSNEEAFEYDEYYINTLYFTHTYDMEDTYVLRLETWNNTHNYGELLDPKYNNTISFYAYDEKEIVVTPNMAALEIMTDNYAYFTFDADGLPTASNQFTIANPGLLAMDWQVVIPEEFSNWISVAIPSGSHLVNGSINNYIYVTASGNSETRYGYFYVHAIDENNNVVQGSPVGIQIEQWGVSGPGSQLVIGANTSQMFGYSVSIDGETAVIGSPGKHIYNASSVFVYQNNHIGVWENVAMLIPPLGQKYFGKAVALHGEYAIVSGSKTAAIYKKPAGGWIGDIYPLQVLEDNGTYTEYEKSVSIWGDYAIVGDNKFNDSRGSVYIYYRNEGGVDQWGRQKLLVGDSPDDFFGTSVSIYNDLLAVGAPQQNSNNGYIDVFYRNESLSEAWSLEQRLTVSSSVDNTKFGNAVSIFENRIATTYRSNYPYHTAILYARSSSRQWDYRLGKDLAGFPTYINNQDHLIRSVALYKDFDNNPVPYNYQFYIGGPDFSEGRGYGFVFI